MLCHGALGLWSFGALGPEVVSQVYESHLYLRDIVTGWGRKQESGQGQKMGTRFYSYTLENTEPGLGTRFG